ncbi:hypothetical protein Hamer_G002038 [Homarus americanus]|uniref:Uncharacterized protein n=1 Tax=Homarus americanus TaxID=6706 RepID=A0A8J5MU05_HOMAM|nr:hypothetical protein Hamer_G002038 [Homarus americanus]
MPPPALRTHQCPPALKNTNATSSTQDHINATSSAQEHTNATSSTQEHTNATSNTQNTSMPPPKHINTSSSQNTSMPPQHSRTHQCHLRTQNINTPPTQNTNASSAQEHPMPSALRTHQCTSSAQEHTNATSSTPRTHNATSNLKNTSIPQALKNTAMPPQTLKEHIIHLNQTHQCHLQHSKHINATSSSQEHINASALKNILMPSQALKNTSMHPQTGEHINVKHSRTHQCHLQHSRTHQCHLQQPEHINATSSTQEHIAISRALKNTSMHPQRRTHHVNTQEYINPPQAMKNTSVPRQALVKKFTCHISYHPWPRGSPTPVGESGRVYVWVSDGVYFEEEYQPSAPIPSSSGAPPLKRSRKTDIIKSPVVIEAMDRTNLSDRNAVFVAGAVAQALGHDIADMSFSRSTIRRYRASGRKQAAETDRKSFSPDEPLLLHWDGKLLPDVQNTTASRIAIVVTFNGQEKLLGVPKKERETGEAQAEACLEAIKSWNVEKLVKGLVFDTTASNTGLHRGACVRIEDELEQELVWMHADTMC